MDIRVEGLRKLRALQKPALQESLRSVVNRAPQAEAYVEQAAARLRPGWARVYEFRRRIATALVCVLTAWLFVHVVFAANGMMVFNQKRAEYKTLNKEILELQKENERYIKQIRGLKSDPTTIEREAREQLHYARPGEVIFVSPSTVSTPPPVTHSASN
ncbi:MAG: septum formation initiator family protein [Acidobacteriota bacterium]|nr:septum formation initiator family protein [Acidobacteriota bacterium]